ncbi:hypothetical protein SAMN05444165_7078 [Paraburkholderia phenazinium]|uniref:Uncharacterized protein n=1 Tax=Paraburkholderia phenazinium TaxID=60549 RepID=A0A1N6LFN4_9BURK|nr:hypothetical protein SAMN05444165_7078 [Paraburkholderia phenazinium]
MRTLRLQRGRIDARGGRAHKTKRPVLLCSTERFEYPAQSSINADPASRPSTTSSPPASIRRPQPVFRKPAAMPLMVR